MSIVGGATIVVLLVDDQAFIAAAIRELLAAESDIELHHCSRAVDAIAVANEVGPTVILQDLVMPDGDGLSLLRAFRANARTAQTPVIMLSGTADEEMRSRALREGASDYLVKLPARDQVISCIRRHAAPVAVAAGVEQAALDTASDDPLDGAVLAAFRQADRAGATGFLTTLIDQFLDEAAVLVGRLSEAARQLDTDSLQAVAHSLKGSANTMGAGKLAALCAQMEHHSTRRRGGVIRQLMADIEQELSRVRDALIAERRRTN